MESTLDTCYLAVVKTGDDIWVLSSAAVATVIIRYYCAAQRAGKRDLGYREIGRLGSKSNLTKIGIMCNILKTKFSYKINYNLKLQPYSIFFYKG